MGCCPAVIRPLSGNLPGCACDHRHSFWVGQCNAFHGSALPGEFTASKLQVYEPAGGANCNGDMFCERSPCSLLKRTAWLCVCMGMAARKPSACCCKQLSRRQGGHLPFCLRLPSRFRTKVFNPCVYVLHTCRHRPWVLLNSFTGGHPSVQRVWEGGLPPRGSIVRSVKAPRGIYRVVRVASAVCMLMQEYKNGARTGRMVDGLWGRLPDAWLGQIDP